MSQYLLSAHSVDGEVREPMAPEDMQRTFEQITALEAEMKETGTWVFAARLHEADTATVVRMKDGDVVTTDGPFAEAKEHIAGFYVIEAPDLDAALGWAARVTAIVHAPIEVRPFADYPGA